MSSFFAELRRRNVFKVGVAYAIVAWLLIEVVATVFPILALPDWSIRLITIVIIIGFPIAVFLAWAYELTPEGIKPAADVDPTGKDSILSGRRLDFLIIGLLVLVVIFLVTDNYVLNTGARDSGLGTREEKISDTNNQGQMTNDIAEKTTEPAPVAEPATNSIAILPFTNLSGDKDQEYFADGLTEEVLNKLAQVRDLQVTGRTSSFSFKGKNIDLREIGKTLGVAYLLEGSVQKSGNRLRITAQLINAAGGYHLWSDTYNRELIDIFTIQDDIAQAVTTALSITLGVGQFNQPGMTTDTAAYDEFLKGRTVWNTGISVQDAIQEIINHMERAVGMDPSFGVAWAYLGAMYYLSINDLPPERSSGLEEKALNYLERARSIAPENPGVLVMTAIIQEDTGSWLEANRILQHLLDRYGRTNAGATLRYGQMLGDAGRSRESLQYLRQAQRLDPLNTGAYWSLALVQSHLGRLDEAVKDIERCNEISSNNDLCIAVDWVIALENHDRERAAAILENFFALDGMNPDANMLKMASLLTMKDTSKALEETRNLAASPDLPPFQRLYLVHIAAVLGDPELALEIRSMEHQAKWYIRLWFGHLRDMRRLPGFKTFLRDRGLVDFWRSTGKWSDFCHPVGEDDFECQ